MTLHQARIEAAKILGLRAEGRDPALERQQAKKRATSDRFIDVAEEFLDKHASQNRTSDETARIIRRDVLPAWGKRSVHGLTRRDVNDLLDTVMSRGSRFMANRLLAALRKLFNWCVSRGTITASPCVGISAPHKEISRDRVLSDAELISVIEAAPFGGIIQLLILTAQRRNEVSRMTWDELDLDKGSWTIPSARTKNEKPHEVHLSDPARAVIANMPRHSLRNATDKSQACFEHPSSPCSTCCPSASQAVG